MRTLPDEGSGRWLDSLDYGLLTEAQTMLGASWANPAARRAVLQHLGDARAARLGRPNEARSTPGEWARRVSRLVRLVDGKERETRCRDRRALRLSPTTSDPVEVEEATAA